jgi:hypothetical protein
MKLSTHWYGVANRYVDVTFKDSGATIEVSMLNQAERKELADHLREISDELSPVSEEIFDD